MRRPDLVKVVRVFVQIIAIVFALSGTAVLVLTLPFHFPWKLHIDLAPRYAVIFLGIAAVLTFAVRKLDKPRR